MNNTIASIQAYLRESARKQYESVSLPPFTLFFHPIDTFKYFNYAIPDSPVESVSTTTFDRLRHEFHSRRRTPRFEFFEAFAPALPALLQANGYTEEARQWSMTATLHTFQDAPILPDLEVTRVDGASCESDVRDFVIAQRQGFDPSNTKIPSNEDVRSEMGNLQRGGWVAYLGRISGEPAGVALYNHPIGGVSEIAGVATRQAYRGRGIASYLTSLASRAAFDQGASIACLTAEDERAGRIYQRIGFQPFSIMLAYISP